MPTASKIILLSFDFTKHVPRARNVKLLAVVRGAHESQISLIETEFINGAGLYDSNSLNGFRCWAGVGDSGGISNWVEDISLCVCHSNVYAMGVFDDTASIGDDAVSVKPGSSSHVELKYIDYALDVMDIVVYSILIQSSRNWVYKDNDDYESKTYFV
jgi:hypothetical protein